MSYTYKQHIVAYRYSIDIIGSVQKRGEIIMESISDSKDLRVQKTIRNIRASFIELLEEKDFSEITVQNILDRAMINRKTFYRYYKDKYDLAQQIIASFTDELIARFMERQLKSYTSTLELAERTYQILQEKRKEILALWNIRVNEINFYDTLLGILQEQYEKVLHDPDEGKNIFSAYLAATLMLHAMKYMLDINADFTPEYMMSCLKNVYNLLSKGLD
jgi:AcrR family transcriptional regulator